MRWLLVGVLVACRSATPVVVPAEPGLKITGHILTKHHAPVAGASVALISDAGLEHHTTADARGAFVFRGVRASPSWGLSAYAPGFTGAFIDFIDPARPIELALPTLDPEAVMIRLSVTSKEALPRDAAVIISRKSTNNADVWAVPVDRGSRTATITLARAPAYFARGLDTLAGNIEIADPAHPPALAVDVLHPAPDSVHAYIREHAIPLDSVEAGHGFADLAPFGTMIGDASVVAIGEATHGTREYFQLKHRLFEYLASEHRFTTLAFEADQAECRAIDDYIQGGPGDGTELVDALGLWVWRTEEVVALVEWMRTYNADPTHPKLHFVGFDMQSWGPAYASLQQFLARVAPHDKDALAAAASSLARAQPDEEMDSFQSLPDDGKAQLAAALAAVQRTIAEHRDDAGYEVAERDARSLAQFVAYFTSNDDTVRDRAMADNILALHEHTPRMMVWAHNYHVGRYSVISSMGIHLQQALGRAYLPIGFVFGTGSFMAAGSLSRVAPHAFGAPTPLDAAVPFAATGYARLALDLRALPGGPISTWFSTPHLVRELGWLYTGDVFDTRARVLRDQFDAVLFVASTTPVRGLWSGATSERP